jgi:hypothetical protein
MTDAITIKTKGITAIAALQNKVDEEIEMRKILTKFITTHMKKGTDFGAILIGGRPSKDCLFKPGAEKIGSLLRLRPDVVRDNDTWEMAGSKPGLFCYKCILYNTEDRIVGMGLGACDVNENKKTMNNAIKIAKKRAFVDAILATGALSDFFTQDLEDEVGQSVREAVIKKAETTEIDQATINSINACKTFENISKVFKELKAKLPKEQHVSLYNYAMKKREDINMSMPDSLVDEVDAALNPQFNNK